MRKMEDSTAQRLLAKYHVPMLRQAVAGDLPEAVKSAKRMGYPVALKISSPDIVHKTEVEGVALGISNESELRACYRKITENVRKRAPKAKVTGFIVQKMSKGSHSRELIIGSKLDDQFGPVIMFGLGGIFVEVLEDVAFRLAPITADDARQMLEEIKAKRLLSGFRGRKAVHKGAIISCLVAVSNLVVNNPNIRELDINPLFADEKAAYAADIRIMVE